MKRCDVQLCVHLVQNAQEELSAAAAAAVVREAAASAVMDVLEGESAEEKACKLAAAKEERMRKVIRSVHTTVASPKMGMIDPPSASQG